MPSTVVISWPSMATPRARHESTGRPSTNTAQHPHSPNSQPCFVPVSPRSSRSTSRSVLCGANATSTCSPLTRNNRCAFSSLFFARFPTCFITLPLADTIWQQDSDGQVLKSQVLKSQGLQGEGTTRSTKGTRKVGLFLCLLCFLWFLQLFSPRATSLQRQLSFLSGLLRNGICRVNTHQRHQWMHSKIDKRWHILTDLAFRGADID